MNNFKKAGDFVAKSQGEVQNGQAWSFQPKLQSQYSKNYSYHKEDFKNNLPTAFKSDLYAKKKDHADYIYKKIKLDDELDSLKVKNMYQEMMGCYQKPTQAVKNFESLKQSSFAYSSNNGFGPKNGYYANLPPKPF